MQREIKFRAYYKPEYTMLDWEFLQTELNHYNKPFVDTDDYKVMQYTGLKDKNGVEIYEGDIGKVWYVNSRDEPLWCIDSVIFSEGMFHFTSFDTGISDELTIRTVEVIGNIYENRELLEE